MALTEQPTMPTFSLSPLYQPGTFGCKRAPQVRITHSGYNGDHLGGSFYRGTMTREEENARHRAWVARNKDKRRATTKKHYASHKEYYRDYREKHREKIAEYQRAYRAKHKARLQEQAKANRQKRIASGADQKRKAAYRDRYNELQRGYREAPQRRLNDSVRNNMRSSLRGQKDGRPWESLVGYDLGALMVHLEALFADGMTWDNYGEWHIDHIIPVSAFNFSSPEHIDFHRCWALSNLQPLWARENLSKNARLVEDFQPSLALEV